MGLATPARATELIVCLELMPNPAQLPILLAGVALLLVHAFVMNRLAGIPYTIWSTAQRKVNHQRKERVMRYFRAINATVLSALLFLPLAASAGWLNPHLETYPDCTKPKTLPSSELLDLTRSGELFVVMADPESDDMDSILALRHGFKGAIFDVDILNDNRPLADQTIRFTDTLVRRDDSFPEWVLGGSRGDSFFFVVRLTAGTFLLHPGSFDHSRFPVCEALREDMD